MGGGIEEGCIYMIELNYEESSLKQNKSRVIGD